MSETAGINLAQDPAKAGLSRLWLGLACLAVILLIPLFLPSYLLGLATKVVILSVFALSLNLIWSAGLISLGHAAYFGISAYVSAILITRYQIEGFWLSAGLGVLAAAVLSAIFGVIALRVRGIYFLMVTLALGQLVYFASMAFRSITGGINGLYGFSWPNLGIELEWGYQSFYIFTLLISVACVVLMYRVHCSTFGNALRGVRSDENKMATLGFNTWLVKYIGLIIAGVFAAIAGILYSYYMAMASPTQLSIKTSTLAVLMLILGGSGVFWGPIVGAVTVVVLEYFASIWFPDRWPMILGLTFVVSVMLLRGGIANQLRIYLSGMKGRNGSSQG